MENIFNEDIKKTLKETAVYINIMEKYKKADPKEAKVQLPKELNYLVIWACTQRNAACVMH